MEKLEKNLLKIKDLLKKSAEDNTGDIHNDEESLSFSNNGQWSLEKGIKDKVVGAALAGAITLGSMGAGAKIGGKILASANTKDSKSSVKIKQKSAAFGIRG